MLLQGDLKPIWDDFSSTNKTQNASNMNLVILLFCLSPYKSHQKPYYTLTEQNSSDKSRFTAPSLQSDDSSQLYWAHKAVIRLEVHPHLLTFLYCYMDQQGNDSCRDSCVVHPHLCFLGSSVLFGKRQSTKDDLMRALDSSRPSPIERFASNISGWRKTGSSDGN